MGRRAGGRAVARRGRDWLDEEVPGVAGQGQRGRRAGDVGRGQLGEGDGRIRGPGSRDAHADGPHLDLIEAAMVQTGDGVFGGAGVRVRDGGICGRRLPAAPGSAGIAAAGGSAFGIAQVVVGDGPAAIVGGCGPRHVDALVAVGEGDVGGRGGRLGAGHLGVGFGPGSGAGTVVGPHPHLVAHAGAQAGPLPVGSGDSRLDAAPAAQFAPVTVVAPARVAALVARLPVPGNQAGPVLYVVAGDVARGRRPRDFQGFHARGDRGLGHLARRSGQGVELGGGDGRALALVAVGRDGVRGVGTQLRQVGLPINGADAVRRRVGTGGGRAAGAGASARARGLIVPVAAMVNHGDSRSGRRNVGCGETGGARRSTDEPWRGIWRDFAVARCVHRAQVVAVLLAVGQTGEGVGRGGGVAVRDSRPRTPSGQVAGASVVVVDVVLVASDGRIGRV